MIRMKWLPWLFMVHIVVVASGRAPNIIVLLCDNLGYGDTQPFWSETPHRTPCLNRMAEEGTRFTHFYVTAGVCTPSRASIMTGKYAQRVGLAKIPVDDHVLRPVSPYGLHPDELTIAEVLKQQGYVTSLIGKWHLGDQPEFLPTRQGFDTYFGIPYSDDMTGPRAWNERKWPPLPLMEGEKVVEAPADHAALAAVYRTPIKSPGVQISHCLFLSARRGARGRHTVVIHSGGGALMVRGAMPWKKLTGPPVRSLMWCDN